MVREMYRHSSLSKWKVVFVTDRTQLEGQLSDTSQSIGFTVKIADSIKKLKELLATDRARLLKNLAEQLTTYATGRGVVYSDRAAITDIVERTEKQGGGIRTLLHEVVQSPLFQTK